ncbi:MAG: hypothetical protein U0694_23780 [Anaerolineae bacterium]
MVREDTVVAMLIEQLGEQTHAVRLIVDNQDAFAVLSCSAESTARVNRSGRKGRRRKVCAPA